jgi:hypothetical protein
VHNLLVSGKRIIDDLFPGLDRELASQGAVRFEWPADFLWLSPVGWGGRARSDLVSVACTRELLETALRRCLTSSCSIQFLEKLEVTGLVKAMDGRVAGLTTRSRPSSRSNEGDRQIQADLVVDASGRDSNISEWLATVGYPRAPVETVNSFSGYATRIYARPPSPLCLPLVRQAEL